MATARLRWTAVATTLMMSFLGTTNAYAEHAKDSSAGDPDNADHYIDRFGLTSGGDTAAVQGLQQLNRSQMNATFTGSGDVEIYNGDYNQISWYGATNCESGFNPFTGNCDVFRVRFDTEMMARFTGLSKWRSLGCHELGHTAGLGHRYPENDAAGTTRSCMRDDIWPEEFDNHDLDAINSSV